MQAVVSHSDHTERGWITSFSDNEGSVATRYGASEISTGACSCDSRERHRSKKATASNDSSSRVPEYEARCVAEVRWHEGA